MSIHEASHEGGVIPIAEVNELQDHCGVWAIWDPNNPELRDNAFAGLQGIQHRGEEGAGVAAVSVDSPGIQYVRGRGKVVDVLGDDGVALYALPADSYAAIGHTHYGTDNGEGDSTQPRVESMLALAHNGQFTNKDELSERYGIYEFTSDSDLVTKIIDQEAVRLNGDVERATLQVLPHLRGAFCLTILTSGKLIAVRDRHGVRPLQLGRTETDGYMVASEVMAIDNVPGAYWEREIEPAEMVVIDENGLRRGEWVTPDPAICVFEYAYLSNKSNVIGGILVADARQQLGKLLADSVGPHVTAIVPIPNSGNQPAHGLAAATGIPYVPAFQKNPNYHQGSRSFMQPNDQGRIDVADGKLILDAELVREEGVAAVDDTLVRGHTAKVNIHKLRMAGAKTVDLFVAAPPYSRTCELGVDTGNPEELIAARMGGDVEKMRRELDVDSLVFLTPEDVRSVLGSKVCDFCIGGNKPNPVINTLDESLPHSDRALTLATT